MAGPLTAVAHAPGAALTWFSGEAAGQRLDHAVNFLRRTRPEMSAFAPVTDAQRKSFLALLGFIILLYVVAPYAGPIFGMMAITLPFTCVTALRLAALWHLFSPVNTAGKGSEEGEGDAVVTESTLPRYSLIVPLYREANVAARLVDALGHLDYPSDRLEVLFITEHDDAATRDALRAASMRDFMRILTVPDGTPRTKPRALNYGLTFATGDMIAIYDAEDAPERGQLKAAVEAFAKGGDDLACVQARLNIYNPGRNYFTRQFTLEYSALFDAVLPALEWLRLPLPLGGTSNHFRRSVLEAAGAWDPYNVTEDADLGIRFARLGKRTAMLSAITWEEAPGSFTSWFAQRTRWIKGWMQTYLVHMRAPGRLLLELGGWRFVGFQVIFGGLILSALTHPIFVISAAVHYTNGTLGAGPDGIEAALWSLATVNLAVCYLSAIAVAALAVAHRGGVTLMRSAIGLPLYWIAISFAAYRALFELYARPHHWAKTAHTGDGREDFSA